MNSLRSGAARAALIGILRALPLLLCFVPMIADAQASPAPAASSASSTPGTSSPTSGGGAPIESILLQYQGAAESAARIAQRVECAIVKSSKPDASCVTADSTAVNSAAPTPPSSMVVIATTADINAVLQLQVALGQGTIIAKRVTNVTNELTQQNFPCRPKKTRASQTPEPVRKSPQRQPGQAGSKQQEAALFTGSIPVPTAADLQTLLQTVASAGAVNESYAAAAGTLSDTSLVNLVAGSLRTPVYVVSAYPPATNTTSFDSTQIGKTFTSLEKDRQKLYAAADNLLHGSACQSDLVANKDIIADLQAEVLSTSALIDTYESSLFSGQTAAPSPSPSPSSGGGANPPPAPPTLASSTTVTVGNAGAPLVALLAADYLLTAIEKSGIQHFFFVTLHSLESGGNVLTKSSIWGSRVLFSGGAAAAFAVYKDDGKFLCSGISYGYRGFIDEQDVAIPGLSRDPTPGKDPQRRVRSRNPAKDGEYLPEVAHFTSASPGCPEPERDRDRDRDTSRE